MNVILFDDQSWFNLLPLTFTRPVCEIRVGIFTIREKWNIRLGTECSSLSQDYLREKYPVVTEPMNLMVNSSLLPDKALVDAIKKLDHDHALVYGENILAAWVPSHAIGNFIEGKFKLPLSTEFKGTISRIEYPWDIFRLNGPTLALDFHILIASRTTLNLSDTNTSIGKNIFIEEGAKIEYAHLNSSSGPIYVGRNAEIMEGSLIRGPFALLENSVVKMGTRVYGPTTVGPDCRIGGEITNSVFFAHSNKAHD